MASDFYYVLAHHLANCSIQKDGQTMLYLHCFTYKWSWLATFLASYNLLYPQHNMGLITNSPQKVTDVSRGTFYFRRWLWNIWGNAIQQNTIYGSSCADQSIKHGVKHIVIFVAEWKDVLSSRSYKIHWNMIRFKGGVLFFAKQLKYKVYRKIKHNKYNYGRITTMIKTIRYWYP